MSSLVQYGAVWLAQVRYTVMRELMFKANFILWVIVDLCWFGLNLAFVQFLYLQVDTIAGWTKWEFIFLVTTNMLVQQIFQMLLMTNLNKLPELIRTGRLDFFLAQPASAQFLVSTRLFELGSVVNVFFVLIVCVYSIAKLNWSFSLAGLVIYPLLIVFGVLIHYAVLLMLMSLAFLDDTRAGLHQRLLQRLSDCPVAPAGFSRRDALYFYLSPPVTPHRECSREHAAAWLEFPRLGGNGAGDGDPGGAQHGGFSGGVAEVWPARVRSRLREKAEGLTGRVGTASVLSRARLRGHVAAFVRRRRD